MPHTSHPQHDDFNLSKLANDIREGTQTFVAPPVAATHGPRWPHEAAILFYAPQSYSQRQLAIISFSAGFFRISSGTALTTRDRVRVPPAATNAVTA